MTEGLEHLDDAALVALIGRALDALTDDRLRLPSDADRLALLAEAVRVTGRLHAWQAGLAAAIDHDDVAWRAHGTSASTWLTDATRHTRTEAHRLIGHGQRLDRFAVVRDAARAGDVMPAQSDAITAVLDQLPADLQEAVVEEAQHMMVGFAATHTSTELRRLTHRLVELLAPEVAEAHEAARLERERAQATRARHLTFTPDHCGSILIKGSLPVAQAELVVKTVNAWAEGQRRALDALDPAAPLLTPAMRRADGLVALVDALSRTTLSPRHGGDRPRVVITMTLDQLNQAACDAPPRLHGRVVGSDRPIDAGTLRQWLCDCEVLPIVLGGHSEVLDQGRQRRLVTDAQRTALAVRDRGCVFPGCEQPPENCHAHHITPWWAGGRTALANLVLLCPHHHGVVEPSHDPLADRWRIYLPAHGPAQVIPPRRIDPTGRPRQHTRYLTPTRT
ncbi:HNH endonuclease signature motif containing protein [Propioniciclava soli]|uniref:HNH endonuclease signature motif containing protein n=1 Tax=Propioniciclava soli TaxID=2775081 RepID=UPI001E313F23|nr:HNH endonuclease signature motif containing protein [Propioniciclava soli]